MHVNEDAPVRSAERVYDRVDEEPDDVDYDEVANEYGEENENELGRNGDGKDRGEGGATGATVGGNNDTTSVGSGMVDPILFHRKNELRKLQTRE
jgi:hypothetical protein